MPAHQFIILVWIGAIVALLGFWWDRRNNRIANDRSLMNHPDVRIRAAYTTSRVNIRWTARALIFAGAIAVVFAFVQLLHGPPHPP